MTFNKTIWSMLVFAHWELSGTPEADKAIEALDAYAAACDGKVKTIPEPCGGFEFEFIPNPIPKY